MPCSVRPMIARRSKPRVPFPICRSPVWSGPLDPAISSIRRHVSGLPLFPQYPRTVHMTHLQYSGFARTSAGKCAPSGISSGRKKRRRDCLPAAPLLMRTLSHFLIIGSRNPGTFRPYFVGMPCRPLWVLDRNNDLWQNFRKEQGRSEGFGRQSAFLLFRRVSVEASRNAGEA